MIILIILIIAENVNAFVQSMNPLELSNAVLDATESKGRGYGHHDHHDHHGYGHHDDHDHHHGHDHHHDDHHHDDHHDDHHHFHDHDHGHGHHHDHGKSIFELLNTKIKSLDCRLS